MENVPLATVERVVESIKHPNADKLSIVTVLGWNVITGLNEYKKDDLVIYIRPDSIIPGELIEELQLTYLKNKGRLKTIRLRGFISQGLILPISILPTNKQSVNTEVSNILNITKYEPPEPSYQSSSKNRPSRINHPDFSKYTKIQNIKNYNTVFKQEDIVHISEKIHGTNTRYGMLPVAKVKGFLNFFKYYWNKLLGKKYEFIYGSHNVQLSNTNKKSFYEDNVYLKIAKKYNLMNIIPEGYIFYGEIYGDGIQKNYNYGLKNEIDIVFFDVKYNGEYVNVDAFKAIMSKYNLPTTPELFVGKFEDANINELKSGKSKLYPKQKIREGCVVKSYNEENNLQVGRKILKCINEEYLLIKNNSEFH